MDKNTLRDIVEQATLAPSIHNTQPWRFVTHQQTIELWTDPSRGLDVLDPTGRARHISCGAALLHARLAAAAAGHATSVQLLPNPAEPTHLADIRLDMAAPPAAERVLARAIPLRHTSREPFSGKPVPDATVRALQHAAAAENAWLQSVGPQDATAVAVLQAHADDIESANPRYIKELRHWTQSDGAARDGVPEAAVPATPPAERGSNIRLRDFVADRERFVVRHREQPPVVERPLIMVLGTDDDDHRAWVEAGQALGRVLLEATVHGVQVSPLTQALEVPFTRARLGAELGIIGHPQMLLRIGHGGGGVASPRRSVADVLTQRVS
ncbi:MAG: nitroreductase family protein [Mycobacteriales bacterium]